MKAFTISTLLALSFISTAALADDTLLYTCQPGMMDTSQIVRVYSTNQENQYTVVVDRSVSVYENNKFVFKRQLKNILMEQTTLINVDEAGLRKESIDPHYDVVLAADDGSILAMDSKNETRLYGRQSVLRQMYQAKPYDNKFLCKRNK